MDMTLAQRMAARRGGVVAEEDGTVKGSQIAEWLLKNAVITDRAAAADALLRLADFGVLEREFGEEDTAQSSVFDAHYHILCCSEDPDGSASEVAQHGLGWVSFFNPQSGNHLAQRLADELKLLLPEERVCDMTKPEQVARGLREWESNRRLKVLICGGDGTFRWVMDVFDEARGLLCMPGPVYGIVPLGTGNDLGIALGWRRLKKKKASRILTLLDAAPVVRLDRWMISLEAPCSTPAFATMNNYFSVGADASAAVRYHRMRLEHPSLVPTAASGKAWYTVFGVLENFKRVCACGYRLCDAVELTVDGIRVALPKRIAAVAVLSTPTIYGGVRAWKGDCSANDGVLEVVAVKGAFHMLGMISHVLHAVKIARGSVIKLMCSVESLPAEIDGEPFSLQQRTTVTILRKGFALVFDGAKH